ncbi:DUF6055 domain-containing protein [Cellulomonas soli]
MAVPGHTADLLDLVRSPELAWSSARLGTGGRLLLQYLAERDGPQVLGELWRDARAGEQPLDTYRRLAGLSIEALHRRVAEYAMRTVTWDFAGAPDLGAALDKVDPLVLRERATPVDADPTTPGIYRVPGVFAPSDQGFTIVRMVPDTAGGTVRVRLRGHADTASAAGWAYGFVAVGDGAARYTTVTESADAEIDFTLREREQEIFLVVVGAPAESHAYESGSGSGSTYRYPFEFAVSGASVEPADSTVTVEGLIGTPTGAVGWTTVPAWPTPCTWHPGRWSAGRRTSAVTSASKDGRGSPTGRCSPIVRSSGMRPSSGPRRGSAGTSSWVGTPWSTWCARRAASSPTSRAARATGGPRPTTSTPRCSRSPRATWRSADR